MTAEAAWRRPALRTGYFAVACAIVAALVLQVYFAGLTLLYDYERYAAWHRGLGDAIELVPLVLSLLAFIGRAPMRYVWQPLVLVLLVGLQHATIHATIGPVRALHPVNALLILGLAVWLALAARPRKAAA